MPERSHRTPHPSLPRLRSPVPSGASAHTHGGALLSFWAPGPTGLAGLASTRGLPPRAGFLHGWHLNRRLGLRAAAADAELSPGWPAPPPPLSRRAAQQPSRSILSCTRAGPGEVGEGGQIGDPASHPGILQFNFRFDFNFRDRSPSAWRRLCLLPPASSPPSVAA